MEINNGHLIDALTEMTGLPRYKFGEGHPYKRWQDAAAEVAWNRLGSDKDKCWICLLAGDARVPKHDRPWSDARDFYAFKLDFVKWLDTEGGKKMSEQTFGSGYPGKTWREAACEVAWQKFQVWHRLPGFRREEMDVKWFLKGKFESIYEVFGYSKETVPFSWDFSAFRSAFMKWLADNERREA